MTRPFKIPATPLQSVHFAFLKAGIGVYGLMSEKSLKTPIFNFAYRQSQSGPDTSLQTYGAYR